MYLCVFVIKGVCLCVMAEEMKNVLKIIITVHPFHLNTYSQFYYTTANYALFIIKARELYTNYKISKIYFHGIKNEKTEVKKRARLQREHIKT